MKKILYIIISCFCLCSFGYSKYVTPSDLGCKEAVYGEKLELGQWYTNFEVCKSYADENGIPLVAVWSNHGCIHCYYLDVCFLQDSFKEWQSSSDAAKVIWCFMGGGESGYPDQAGSTAYIWMYKGGGTTISQYPFVVLWWKDNGVNVRATGDAMRNGLSLTDSYIAQSTQNVIANIEDAFEGWNPVVGPELDDVSFKLKSDYVAENARTYSIAVERSIGTNESVSAQLKLGTSTSKAVVLNNSVSWEAWETGTKYFEIQINDDEETDADEVLDFTLETNADSSKASTFTLTIVEDDKKAPAFNEEECTYEIVQYSSFEKTIAMKSFGKNMIVTKVSGTLPTGVKTTLNSSTHEFVISGTPTKHGTFESTYKVVEVIDGQYVVGNTLTLTLNVHDVTEINSTLTKTVTLNNGMVMNNGELVGLVNLSIPKTGKISAKYTSKDGYVSFTSKAWEDATVDCLKTITAIKSGKYFQLAYGCGDLIEAYVCSSNSQNEVVFDYIKTWTKAEFAEYAGTYTASLRQVNPTNPSANDGYITLKISASSYSSGRVTVAGMLPDGKTFSTSSVLQYNDYREIAIVPVFVKTATDVFSAVVSINADKTVGIDKSTTAKWQRIDKYVSDANVKETIKIDGMMFDKTINIADYSLEKYNTTNFNLTVDSSSIVVDQKYGQIKSFELPAIHLKNGSIVVDSSNNNVKLKLTYSKTTGLLSGSMKIPFENGTATGTIKGLLFNASTIPVMYSGKLNGKTIKCGFNIKLEAQLPAEEDCGCD